MAKLPKSPLAPASFPTLPPIAGVRLGAMEAGIKYKGRYDLALWLLDEGTTVAGAFTKSLTAGAPVQWCQDSLHVVRARSHHLPHWSTGHRGERARGHRRERGGPALGLARSVSYVATSAYF